MSLSKNVILSLLVIGGSAYYAQAAEINYSGPSYTPYLDTDTSLTLNISGNSTAAIVALNGGTLDNPGGTALAINYNSGNTHYYLSSLGSTGTVNGDIVINVIGGTFNNQTGSPAIAEAFIGTSYGTSAAIVDGNVLSTISGGSFYGNVFAGGGATVTGDVSLIITDGTFVSDKGVFGGSSWGGVVDGNSLLKITGGDFSSSDIYGGSYRTGAGFDRSITGGDTSVVIEGGTFRNINGGSFDGKAGDATSKAGQTNGNASVSINAGSAVTISGDINVASGNVQGDSVITFSGNASNLTFNGTIRDHSANDSSQGSLEGTASIQFEAFTGTFNASIANGFDNLSVTGASTLDFAHSFSVDTFVISEGATALLQVGTSFNKLTLLFSDDFLEGQEFVLNLETFFGDSVGLVSNLLSEDAEITLFGNTQEWTASFDTGTNMVTVTEAVPEPTMMISLLSGGLLLAILKRLRRREETVSA